MTYPLPAGTGAGLVSIEAAYSGGAGFNASAGTGALTIGQRRSRPHSAGEQDLRRSTEPNPLTTADISGFLAADAITATFARAPGGAIKIYGEERSEPTHHRRPQRLPRGR